ncbi:MAG TPA: ABATE domain-containing protein [Candidatus Angelobacter sp.]|nr:ABATE domain-containing protein [Candidatus Angelobacter sp.]
MHRRNVKQEPPKPDSPWRDGFLFVGNHLALDFLNTQPVQNGEVLELLPDFAALLRWFQAAKLLSAAEADKIEQRWGSSDRAQHTLEIAKELRERLRKDVLAWEDGKEVHRSTIIELNRLMAEYPMRTRLKATLNALTKETWFATEQTEALLSPLAHAAAGLFAEGERGRIRKCEQCVLHFQDTSKKGTRRWCSMQLCGNRLKVAAYAARKRSE